MPLSEFILPFPDVRNYVYAYTVFDRQKSDIRTHRHSEDTSVWAGYGVKCICSVGSWHPLFHPPALMALFPSVDIRCITVPLSLVTWPVDYTVLYFDLFLGRESHANTFKRINTYKWDPWNHKNKRKRGKTNKKLLQSAQAALLSAQLFISHVEKAKSWDLQTTDVKMVQLFHKHWPLLIAATNFTSQQCLPGLWGKNDCVQHICSTGLDFSSGFNFQGFGDQKPQKCSHSHSMFNMFQTDKYPGYNIMAAWLKLPQSFAQKANTKSLLSSLKIAWVFLVTMQGGFVPSPSCLDN